MGLCLCWKRKCGSLTMECVAEALIVVLLVCCFVVVEDQLSVIWERMNGVSSSSASSSSLAPLSSWDFVACVACPIVDCLRVVVEIGGRGPCWLCESAAYKVAERGVPFRPSCAVVFKVTSFVRFLLSLLILVRCWCVEPREPRGGRWTVAELQRNKAQMVHDTQPPKH